LGVGVDAAADLVGDVLVDEDNGNVLAFLGEAVKGVLDGVCLGLVVYDEIVLLSIRRVGNVSDTSEQDSGHRVL